MMGGVGQQRLDLLVNDRISSLCRVDGEVGVPDKGRGSSLKYCTEVSLR